MSISRRSVRAGFTLVELMVVVAIIGILAAIGVPRLIAYARTSETSEVVQAAGRIASAIATHADTQGVALATLVTAINAKPDVTVARGTTDLSGVIPVIAIADDSNFDYKVSTAVATAGPLTGRLAVCVKATGRASSGVSGGVVLVSNTDTVSGGWEGRVNRVAYVNGGTAGATAGGYCAADGTATGTCSGCGGT